MAMGEGDHPFEAIEATFKRAVAALNGAEVPFLLGGSLAVWAHGGAETRSDLDLMLKHEDIDRALGALREIGMEPEDPPEEWLMKAWDGNVLVDLIHNPKGIEITDEVIERGIVRDVAAMRVRVMASDDIMVSKLLALGEHSLDFEGSLQVARSLREKIDWDTVRRRTTGSPYARAFLLLVSELGIDDAGAATDRPRVRVVDGGHPQTHVRRR